MESIISEFPSLTPLRMVGRRCGTWLMFSMPPTTAVFISPDLMARAAEMMACMPLPQTLLMVVHGVDSGMPAASAACLAGACPMPALRTLPM